MNGSSPVKTDPQTATRTSPFWPDASLFGVALIWGINIPIMKTGLDQLDIYVFNAIRLAISAVVLSTFALRERRQQDRSARPAGVRLQVLVYAVMVSVVYQLLFLLGIVRTTSGNTALIIATIPIWTAILAWVFIGEHLRRWAWCGLILALAGTIIVALQNEGIGVGREYLWGNLLILASAVVWSAGTVYARPLLKKISSMQLSASAAVIALPVHVCLASSQYASSVVSLGSGQLWLIILYAGLLSSGLSQPMWYFGLRHAGAAHAAIIQNFIPLVAIVTAWLARGEAVTGPQLLGGALIVGGLVMMRFSRGS